MTSHQLFRATIVAALLGLTGFALMFLPWDDRGDVVDPCIRPILGNATIGGFVGGFALQRHFGAPGWTGWLRSVAAYVAAVIVGGAVSGFITVPGLLLNGPLFGSLVALVLATGLPFDPGMRPFRGLAINCAAIVATHVVARRLDACGDGASWRPFWAVALILCVLLAVVGIALFRR